MMNKFVVAYANESDGSLMFTLVGPFDTRELADEYKERRFGIGAYTMEIETPRED